MQPNANLGFSVDRSLCRTPGHPEELADRCQANEAERMAGMEELQPAARCSAPEPIPASAMGHCRDCGRERDVNPATLPLPGDYPVPEVGQRMRCSACGSQGPHGATALPRRQMLSTGVWELFREQPHYAHRCLVSPCIPPCARFVLSRTPVVPGAPRSSHRDVDQAPVLPPHGAFLIGPHSSAVFMHMLASVQHG
jgi:hypothetical protein